MTPTSYARCSIRIGAYARGVLWYGVNFGNGSLSSWLCAPRYHTPSPISPPWLGPDFYILTFFERLPGRVKDDNSPAPYSYFSQPLCDTNYKLWPCFQFLLKKKSNSPSVCRRWAFNSGTSRSNLCAPRAPAARRSIKSQPVSCFTTDLPVFGSSVKKSVLRRSIVFWLEESCWVKSRLSVKESNRRNNKRLPRSGARKQGGPDVLSCECSPISAGRPRKKDSGAKCRVEDRPNHP